jgi:hypothetical protein
MSVNASKNAQKRVETKTVTRNDLVWDPYPVSGKPVSKKNGNLNLD